MIRSNAQFLRLGPHLRLPVRCIVAPMLAVAAVVLSGGQASADFRVCNTTNSLVGVAVGHNSPNGWTTDGWWNLEPNSCRTLLRGDLIARYYYVYAIDYELGGEWGGDSYMCTRDTAFTIEGIENCEGRGYVRTGFFEVDTREQRSWTVQLTDPAVDGADLR
jgi:uncharacterized membrane protein